MTSYPSSGLENNNQWREGPDSEEDAPVSRAPSAVKKRSSRACDSCRKTKSKCERSLADDAACKSCLILGTECTFLGPSYKRGPPKGYIHAIESRWHQVESLLGALLASPDSRVQSVLFDLRQDSLAREIIARVDQGPFGPSGRHKQPEGATKEDFFATIMGNGNQDGTGAVSDSSRSRRQSRVSREIVSSSTDNGVSAVPTLEWQDRISARLAASSGCRPSTTSSAEGSTLFGSTPYSNGSGHASSSNGNGALPNSFQPSSAPSHKSQFDFNGYPTGSQDRFAANPKNFDLGEGHATQRRRIDVAGAEPEWNEMYKMESPPSETDESEGDDTAEGFGQLSLDEHREVRFHGKASGLYLLPREDRTDDRTEGGVWRLPMARVWPQAKGVMTWQIEESEINVQMPPLDVQEHYIDLYFTYVHPVFPVLHKRCFLEEWARGQRRTPPTPDQSGSPKPEPCQVISKLLLMTIFSIAARYADHDTMPHGKPHGKMWEAGCGYLEDAREILNRVFHRSRASTCQALLLLGHREFGIGSMEQGWNYLGQAMRMAHDLGLNRNADKWQIHGHPIFSPEEKQIRKQIWWTCFVADKYASTYMGRPVSIKTDDFDTPLPDIYAEEDEEIWEPLLSLPSSSQYKPIPSKVMTCFRAASALAVLTGEIVSSIYPVRCSNRQPRPLRMLDLERRLDQWYIDLPNCLQYTHNSKRPIPSPHVLFLHIRYWGSVLLLHRAFIPNWKSDEAVTETDGMSLKAFDMCQAAASQVSAVVTALSENFGLKTGSPLLSSYLLSSGIMNISTLTVRPGNQQASIALRQCLNALQEMEMIWPSAERAFDLLNGALEQPATPMPPGPDRGKRPAHDAFEEQISSSLQGNTSQTSQRQPYVPPNNQAAGVQDFSARLFADMLGLDVPGAEPSTSFLPGYEWWPPVNSDSTGANGTDMGPHQNVPRPFDHPPRPPAQQQAHQPQQRQLAHAPPPRQQNQQQQQHAHALQTHPQPQRPPQWTQMQQGNAHLNAHGRGQDPHGYDYFAMPLNMNPQYR